LKPGLRQPAQPSQRPPGQPVRHACRKLPRELSLRRPTQM